MDVEKQVEETTEDQRPPEPRFCPSAVPDDELVPGYPQLAAKMDSNSGTATFRRFTTLNFQNLLYLQAELVDLEQQLRKLEQESFSSGDIHRKQFSCAYSILSSSPLVKKSEEWDLFQKIRAVLKEYNETLTTVSNVMGLPQADKYDIYDLQRFMQRGPMAKNRLSGEDWGVWGIPAHPDSYAPDLAALTAREIDDSFSKWFANKAVAHGERLQIDKMVKSYRLADGVYIDHAALVKIAFWITSIIAALFPVTSIVILYFVEPIAARFCIIAAFNLLLSACLTAFTTAKRTDIFAVTAAFAAVQVVFVGVNERS